MRTSIQSIMDGFFATAMANYEPGSVQVEITAMIAEGDRVVMQWTSRARTRDGRPYENGCIGVFTARDGRIQSAASTWIPRTRARRWPAPAG